MSVVAAAVVGSAVVGAYSAKQSAKAQAGAADRAASTEEAIAMRNIDFQSEMAQQQREDFAPWRDVGEQALQKIWSGMEGGEFEADPAKIKESPIYQFRQQEGVEALDKSAAARGRLLSGAQDKALTQYGQNLASQAWAEEQARKDRRFNMLASLSGAGQASAAGQAQSTGQLSSTVGNILARQGAAQSAAIQQGGAARAGAYQGQAQAVNQAAQNWMLYKSLGAGA